MAKTPKAATKKPRADKAVSTKSTAKVVGKIDAAKKDRRGTPKGNASGVGRGRGGGGKIGNPPFVPTPEQRIEVCAMVACGTEQGIIADILGCSVDTLQRHFRAELERGKARLLGRIGGSMFRDALDPNKPNYHDSRKYVLARVGGWKATTSVEASGPGGGALVVTINGADAKL